ncbi:ESX secretion-associated protein EspG [Nocardia heshunensis]
MNWTFTDVELKVLCDWHSDGVLPEPFTFTSETEYQDDFERELRDTREQLGNRLDPAFTSIFETVARPDVFVTVHGWSAAPNDPAEHVRLHGARRGARACLMTQLPGESPWHSGGFILTECDPHDLSMSLTRHLPNAAAGAGPDIPLIGDGETQESRRGTNSMFFDEDDDETPETRCRSFASTPAEWEGMITVRQGWSCFGPRGITESRLLWRDLAGDGRYVIELDDHPTATSTTTTALALRIDHHLNHILRTLDAEQEYR